MPCPTWRDTGQIYAICIPPRRITVTSNTSNTPRTAYSEIRRSGNALLAASVIDEHVGRGWRPVSGTAVPGAQDAALGPVRPHHRRRWRRAGRRESTQPPQELQHTAGAGSARAARGGAGRLCYLHAVTSRLHRQATHRDRARALPRRARQRRDARGRRDEAPLLVRPRRKVRRLGLLAGHAPRHALGGRR